MAGVRGARGRGRVRAHAGATRSWCVLTRARMHARSAADHDLEAVTDVAVDAPVAGADAAALVAPARVPAAPAPDAGVRARLAAFKL